MNQLRDIITQAVSSQMQLQKVREDHGLSQPRETGSYDEHSSEMPHTRFSNDFHNEEQAKLRCERNMLKKQIPVNV